MDFEVIEPISDTEEFYFKVEEKATIVAQDAAGGIFALIGDNEVEKLPVIYVSSEGQAGKVAKSFNDFISIMLACSYWRDLLKFSGNGQITEMMKAQPFLEAEIIEDFPGIEDIKDKVISQLSVKERILPNMTIHNVLNIFYLVLNAKVQKFS